MRRCKLGGGVVMAAVIATVAWPSLSQDEAETRQATDLGGLVKETMVFKMADGQNQLAMWFPFEVIVALNMADGSVEQADLENQLKFMRPYHTIIVQCGADQLDGSTKYATQKEVRARAVLQLADGTELKPVDKVPPLVAGTVDAMKTMIAAEGDEGSANMWILVFPATDEEGEPLIDVTQKDKLTLVLKEDSRYDECVMTWRTPFDALTEAAPCKKCQEGVSAKWTYCPWCGADLE